MVSQEVVYQVFQAAEARSRRAAILPEAPALMNMEKDFRTRSKKLVDIIRLQQARMVALLHRHDRRASPFEDSVSTRTHVLYHDAVRWYCADGSCNADVMSRCNR